MLRKLTAGALTAALAALVAGCGGPDKGDVVSYLPWTLLAVSDDARTLTISHELPHCGTEAAAPVVRQRADAVEISVAEVSDGEGGEMACTLEMRMGTSEVKLSAPLGPRSLRAPTRRGKMRVLRDRPIVRVRPDECVPLLRVPEDAAARDVPWVANRIAACTAPLPAEFRKLPIMRRARTSADDLPKRLAAAITEHGRILRATAARRIAPGSSLWLVPGPRWTCVGRIRGGYADLTDCQSSRTVAGRGLFVAAKCVRRTPQQISLVGIVPAGTDRVRLLPKRGARRTVTVRRDGTWSARAPYPLEVAWGRTRLEMTYDMRACWA